MEKSALQLICLNWPSIMEHARRENRICPPAFRTWIHPLVIERVEENGDVGIIYLSFEEEQYLSYIDSHFGAILELACMEVLVRNVLPEKRPFQQYEVRFCSKQSQLAPETGKVLLTAQGGHQITIHATDDDTTLVVSGEGVLDDIVARYMIASKEIDETRIHKIYFDEAIDLDHSAFASYFPNVEMVSLPLETIRICAGAFEGCGHLKSLRIPPNVYCIDEQAFEGSGLERIEIPKHMTWIRRRAFYHCVDLAGDIIISESVEEVEEESFAGVGRPVRLIFMSAETVIDRDMLGSNSEDHEQITIAGYRGSTAEVFAREAEIRFEEFAESKQ